MGAALDIRPWARRRGIPRRVSDFGRVRSRKTPAGKQRFFIDMAKFGRLYRGRDALGEFDFETREAAESYLARIRARIEDGKAPDLVLDQIRPKARRTIPELAKRWLEVTKWNVSARKLSVRLMKPPGAFLANS